MDKEPCHGWGCTIERETIQFIYTSCAQLYIHIYVPRAPTTSIFEGDPPRNKAFLPIKTRVAIWIVPESWSKLATHLSHPLSFEAKATYSLYRHEHHQERPAGFCLQTRKSEILGGFREGSQVPVREFPNKTTVTRFQRRVRGSPPSRPRWGSRRPPKVDRLECHAFRGASQLASLKIGKAGPQ